jgi:16S rRNA processing protein RimM
VPQRLAIGRVARAHGLRGRVLIAPYNAGSEGLCQARRIWLGEREFEVDRAQRVAQGYLVALRGVGDRDQADALRGEEVRVDRAELPALEAGEMYAIDLIGYQVSDPQGTVRGVVEDLEEAGPQDLLRLDGGTLVPLALVTEVQPQARRIVVDAPEGLFDLEE